MKSTSSMQDVQFVRENYMNRVDNHGDETREQRKSREALPTNETVFFVGSPTRAQGFVRASSTTSFRGYGKPHLREGERLSLWVVCDECLGGRHRLSSPRAPSLTNAEHLREISHNSVPGLLRLGSERAPSFWFCAVLRSFSERWRCGAPCVGSSGDGKGVRGSRIWLRLGCECGFAGRVFEDEENGGAIGRVEGAGAAWALARGGGARAGYGDGHEHGEHGDDSAEHGDGGAEGARGRDDEPCAWVFDQGRQRRDSGDAVAVLQRASARSAERALAGGDCVAVHRHRHAGARADSLARKPSLQVTILCDALRTTRPSRESDVYPSSAAMLSNILLSDRAPWRKSTTWDRPKDPVRVALYHTPMLNQALKMVLPARVQEVVGVCHLKVFVFDDNVIMTGANMSTSYFTVRQDRYLCFPDCKNLASYFCSLINRVALYSYTLDDTGKLQPRSAHLDPVTESELFCTELSDSVTDLTAPSRTDAGDGGDTWVFPTVQMGPLGIRQDEAAMLWLLKQLPGGSDMHLSSPYFNLTPEYEDAVLEAARDKYVHVLTASPKANGFYGSSGIAGFIPLAYSLLEQQLHNRAMSTGNDKEGRMTNASAAKKGLSIYEYERLGWTFHAKGLWCSLPGAEEGPSVSLVGSSNLGFRSRDRDLEAQVFLFTQAPRLQQQLERERDDLFVRASKVNSSVFRGPDRQGGMFASLALKLVKPWL